MTLTAAELIEKINPPFTAIIILQSAIIRHPMLPSNHWRVHADPADPTRNADSFPRTLEEK
jgi:hypothetical protein